MEHYNQFVAGKARVTFFFQIILYIILLVVELVLAYPGKAWIAVLIFRLIIIGWCVLGLYLMKHVQPRHFDIVLPTLYGLIGATLLLLYGVASESHIADSNYRSYSDFPPYLFYLGRWSLPNSLIYIYIIFATSGMRVRAARVLAIVHCMALIAIVFLFYNDEFYGNMLQMDILYVPVMVAMSIISVQDLELQVRTSFVMKCELGEKLHRQDNLITSILPEKIAIAIKNKRIENLAKPYDNVTILFCYIVDFGRQSSSTYAQVHTILYSKITSMIYIFLFFIGFGGVADPNHHDVRSHRRAHRGV